MSGEIDCEADDGMFFDDDWLYIEDDYPLADELAETSVPDPGYAGTNYEISMGTFSYDDPYEFWDDLEYGQHEYWDYCGRSSHDGGASKAGAKRSHSPTREGSDVHKRRKLGNAGNRRCFGGAVVDYLPVVFISRAERSRSNSDTKPAASRLPRNPASFLADWRTRYAHADTLITKAMPPDMQQAAEAYEDDEEEGNEDYDDDVSDDNDDDDDETLGPIEISELLSAVARGNESVMPTTDPLREANPR